MSEGELLQMEKARKLNIKESVYYDVIKGKTASLFAAACSAGAASVSQEEEVIEDFRQFGEHIGMAFQIKDDLFDFGVQDVGKPLGIDIKEKKMTLPLIYALQNASASQRRATINLIKNGSKKPEQVREVIQFVRDSGGMEYAQKVMVDFRTKAFDLLHKYEESPARIALENLVTYVTDRKK
jgi:octaprenyl-diphosphate synthase